MKCLMIAEYTYYYYHPHYNHEHHLHLHQYYYYITWLYILSTQDYILRGGHEFYDTQIYKPILSIQE